MTTCAHAERLVPLLYDGELDGPIRREVSSHIAGCSKCSRLLADLDRGQELLRQTIETELEQLDFSGFWRGVEEKLTEQKFPWTVRLRLWGEQWRPRWNFSSPAWVVATACLLVALGLGLPPLYVALTTSVPPPYSPQHVPLEDSEPFALAANEAQIESLSATDPIMVWNEPTSNATVIWVGDEGEGGSP